MKKVTIQLAARQSKRFRITYNSKKIIFSGPIGNLSYDFPVYRMRFFINYSRGEASNESSLVLYDRGLLSWFKSAYKGVYSGFSQHMVLNGNSFKADYSIPYNSLLLDLGFSHFVCVKLPSFCKISIQKRTLLFFSHDKTWLRSFLKWFQRLRIPDSYKGKGILFQGQIWKTKPGKQRQ